MNKKELILKYSLTSAVFLSINYFLFNNFSILKVFIYYILCFICAYFFLFIYFLILDYITKKLYGISYDIYELYLEIVENWWDYEEKIWKSASKKINISFLIHMILGILSLGFFFPYIWQFKWKINKYLRIGKNLPEKITYKERLNSIAYSLLTTWFLFSVLSWLSYKINNIVFIFILEKIYYLLVNLSISLIIPWNLILMNINKFFKYISPSKPISVILTKSIRSFSRAEILKGPSIGDELLISKISYYRGFIVSIILCILFSLFLDPIFLISLIIISWFYVWLRSEYLKN